ncbi:MAG TPA: glycosyltransferase family 39 protein [Planctomycetaceae bacterium]|nr:glycosyltransferase family 39 protein [Planctomycetaceae bacterium]
MRPQSDLGQRGGVAYGLLAKERAVAHWGDSVDATRWSIGPALILALVFFCFPLTLGIPLVDPDEGLHAAVAQEMVERGDWVTPRFVGQPFLDKPILFTWAQGASLALWGMSEWAVRLPGLMFGLFGCLTTGVVAGRLYDRRTGMVAAVLYTTMVLPTALSQCAAHDVALVPWVNLGILAFWEADRAAGWRAKAGLTVVAGLVVGLSCLAKGLVGVGLVGVAYGSYLLVTRRLRVGACVRGVVALCLGGLVAGGWYVAMERASPGYLYYFFVERHLLGLVTEGQRHGGRSWWYYLPILAAGTLPWCIYFPAGLRHWWASRHRPTTGDVGHDHSGASVLVLCWFVACTALLSAAGSKLVTYIWPVLPAVAILVARVWVRAMDGGLAPAARRWFAAAFWGSCLTGPLVLPAVMAAGHAMFSVSFTPVQWVVGALIGFSAWLPLAFWVKGRRGAVLWAGSLSIAAQFAVGFAWIGPVAAARYSAIDLATYLNRFDRLPDRLIVVEERIGSLVFYLRPDLRAQLKTGQFRAVRASAMHELAPVPRGGLIAVAETRADEVARYMDLDAASFRRAGRYRLYTPVQMERLQRSTANKRRGDGESPKDYAAREESSAPCG